jgi:hypothetical protein
MASTPPESPEPADPHDAWNKLVKLNRMMIRQSGLTLPTLSAQQSPEPAPGAPPTVLALAAEIDNAKQQFSTFTSQATALKTSIGRGEAVTDEQIGSALDKARAWVDYFGPHGPLCRGFPASIPPQVYVDALARVGQLQRLAEQWVGYFNPLWEKRSSSEQGLAQDEEGCLQRAAQAEQMVKQRQMSFTLNSSNLSSQQMQGYIQELNDLLATVHGWIATAKGPACARRLEGLSQQINSVLGNFRYSYNSKRAFEEFQRQQGLLPPSGGPIRTGRPGPGSPEWYTAITGMNCYWCGQDFGGLPKPVITCPHCGRFPQPGP